MSNYFIAVQTVPVSLSVCFSSPIDIDMFDIFWLKSNRYRYVGYVLSQVQGISICWISFDSSPTAIDMLGMFWVKSKGYRGWDCGVCHCLHQTRVRFSPEHWRSWTLRKVKHFPFFLVSLIMLFWFNLPAVRHGGPGWLRDHLGRDKRQASQALRKPGRQGRPGGVFKTQAGNLLTSWEPTLL